MKHRQVDGRHRAEVRPRYGRLSVLGSSLFVLGVALLGGVGVIPTSNDAEPPRAAAAAAGVDKTPEQSTATPEAEDSAADPSPSATVRPKAEPKPDPEPTPTPPPKVDTSPPSDSGTGRRVVFSAGRQRVWLMSDDTEVEQTYPVSGSIYDNLDPGTFEVYSRSEDAYGIDDSGTMKYFVRFTRGPSGAAIGFHDIPVKDGERIQGFDDLGTPLSHGCIRQRRSDAIDLWEFAPIGTKVVVTA